MKQPSSRLSIEWQAENAPALSAVTAAHLITSSESLDLVLQLNRPQVMEFKSEGPVMLHGTFPSGQTFQKWIELGSNDSPVEVVIGEHPTRHAPIPNTHKLLGTYKSLALPNIEPSEGKGTKAKKSWEQGLWLRLWTMEHDGDSRFSWKSESIHEHSILDRLEDALIVRIRESPVSAGRFLEMGRQGSLSRFVALPPVSDIDAVIRGSSNDSIPEVNLGLTLKVTAADIRYSIIESAIQYLVAGSTSEAFTLAVDLAGTWDWSEIDPYVCTAAGYFFMKTGRFDIVGKFIESFNETSPQLADSAILLARYLIATAPKDPRIPNLVIEAGSRGIPLFSDGLRNQFELLRKIEAGFDPMEERRTEVERQITALGSFLSASHEVQVLTTYFGLNPWRPTMDHLMATPIGDRSFVNRLMESE